jgi:hypothetical protein
MSRRAVLAACVIAVAASCGYRFPGAGPHLPPEARTISIEPFVNRTRERGLEIALQRAIEEEFRRRGPLRVVDGPTGDLVLSGTIRRFSSPPVAFGTGDEAVRYRGTLQVAVRLRERSSGAVLFRARAIQESLDFVGTPGVLVTSSPRFQQGTLQARDLLEMTNVQLIEARRRDALAQLVEAIAREAYVQAMEAF